MGAKLRNLTLALAIGGLATAVAAPAAHANRGTPTTTTTQPGYVPPPVYGEDPVVLPEENPYSPAPVEDAPVVEPTVVPVDLPAATDPGLGLAGGGDPLGPAPTEDVLGDSGPGPSNGGFVGGVLTRTGAETLPLARTGLAALALGTGLVVLTRRRRVEPASA